MGMRSKDLAKITGVSTSTISLVLNNKPGVSDNKRKEIIEKIKELNCEYLLKADVAFQENIGFVVFKRRGKIIDESPFFAYFLEGINSRVKQYGYNLTFIYMNKDMSVKEQEQQIQASGCKGMIIFAVEMIYEDLQAFKKSKLPFVILDNSFQINDVDAVAINNVQGIYKAVQYLVQLGHTKIGYIKSKVPINSFIERYNAFLMSLEKFNLPFNPEYVAEIGYSNVEMGQDMDFYLNNAKNLPTAFISDNDFLACGVMRSIIEKGYKIPDDISIIGFDDRPICSMVEPKMTTMAVPKNAFANNVVDLLIDKLNNRRNYTLKIEVGTSLLIRESVRSIFQ